MASCDLSLELDGGKTRYRPGEIVSGNVVVRTDADVKCDGLDAKLQWFTHGKGNEDEGDVLPERLFTGEWKGGQTLAYPFRFEAPAAPISYAGELLNVDFRVRATADIPWAIDPEAHELIEIAHERPPTGLKVSWDPETHKEGVASCLGCSIFVFLLGVGVFAFAFEAVETVAVLALLTAVFGIIGFLMTIGRFLAERKLGVVKLELQQTTSAGYRDASRPDQLKVAALSRAGAKVNHATAVLEVREEVVRGSGTNKKTYKHEIYDTSTTLTQTAPGRHEGMLQLPVGTAPYSFEGNSNKLLWQVRVHIDIPGSPDWKETVQLEAIPTSE